MGVLGCLGCLGGIGGIGGVPGGFGWLGCRECVGRYVASTMLLCDWMDSTSEIGRASCRERVS